MNRLIAFGVLFTVCATPTQAQSSCSRPDSISVGAWNSMSAEAQARACGINVSPAAPRTQAPARKPTTQEDVAKAFEAGWNAGLGAAPQRQTAPCVGDSLAYAGVGRGHWVDEVIASGKYVLLEDESLWEISPLDRVNTSIWLPVTDITVRAVRGVGGFNYELINTDDHEKANARLISR
jgi:hypothetical protein